MRYVPSATASRFMQVARTNHVPFYPMFSGVVLLAVLRLMSHPLLSVTTSPSIPHFVNIFSIPTNVRSIALTESMGDRGKGQFALGMVTQAMRVSFPSNMTGDEGRLLKHMAEALRDGLDTNKRWLARSTSWMQYFAAGVTSLLEGAA